jgi:hypothetical protein
MFVKASFPLSGRLQLRRADVERGSQSALTSYIRAWAPQRNS